MKTNKTNANMKLTQVKTKESSIALLHQTLKGLIDKGNKIAQVQYHHHTRTYTIKYA